MRAFFARVGKKGSQEFGLAGGDTVIFVGEGGEVGHPRTGEIMKPKPPGGPLVDDPIDRRRALVGGLVRSDDLSYARNLANRYWGACRPRGVRAEELLDGVDFACGTQEKFKELPLGYRAIALPDSDFSSDFLDAFGRPRRAVPCECERSEAPTMTQALLMMSG